MAPQGLDTYRIAPITPLQKEPGLWAYYATRAYGERITHLMQRNTPVVRVVIDTRKEGHVQVCHKKETIYAWWEKYVTWGNPQKSIPSTHCYRTTFFGGWQVENYRTATMGNDLLMEDGQKPFFLKNLLIYTVWENQETDKPTITPLQVPYQLRQSLLGYLVENRNPWMVCHDFAKWVAGTFYTPYITSTKPEYNTVSKEVDFSCMVTGDVVVMYNKGTHTSEPVHSMVYLGNQIFLSKIGNGPVIAHNLDFAYDIYGHASNHAVVYRPKHNYTNKLEKAA